MVCSFQHVLRQIWVRFCLKHWKTLFLRDFILKPTERAEVLLKNGNRDFQNIERYQCFNSETDFLEKQSLF